VREAATLQLKRLEYSTVFVKVSLAFAGEAAPAVA
jgi:hypothetical protein